MSDVGFTDRPAVPRRIVGFHTDVEGQWVAELECGHAQHVRHDPPWQQRPWVITPEGRARYLGTELRCVRCAEEGAATARESGWRSQPAPGRATTAMEYPPHEQQPQNDGATMEAAAPAAAPTEPEGVPPSPRSEPHTAFGVSASAAEPRLPRAAGARASGEPRGLVRAMDRVLDLLDAVGDAVRAAAGRGAG